MVSPSVQTWVSSSLSALPQPLLCRWLRRGWEEHLCGAEQTVDGRAGPARSRQG